MTQDLRWTTAGNPEGPPLVMIHGMAMSARMYRHVVPVLGQHYRLLLPDRRGLGQNKHLKPNRTMQAHADDIAQLLAQEGITRTHILGVSMGGLVAQQLVHSYPQLVDRLVLINTFSRLEWYKRLGLYLLPGLIPLGIEKLMKKMALYQLGIGPPSSVPGQRIKGLLDDAPAGIMAWEGRAIRSFSSRPWLKDIARPTLIIGATKDKIVPPSESITLLEGIPGARLEYVAGGHGAIVTHFQAILPAVLHFLAGGYPPVPPITDPGELTS